MKTGLNPTPIDERDFKLGAVVGLALPSDMPDEYTVADPLIIKDQGQSDMCTAYAITAVSEDEEGVVLDPFFTFGVTKAITGDPAEWGADLRSACKSAVKPRTGDRAYGSLEAKDLSKLTKPATQEDRERASDYRNITVEEREEAKRHAKKSYFSVVDGVGDIFDDMRSAMWMTRNEKRSIFTGCNWRTVWTYGGGTIETAPSGQTFGHAVKAFGWRGGYMKLQLSNGKSIGEDGIFWISRLALNQAFTFGAFTFLDMPREDAEKTIAESKKSKTFFTRVVSPFANLFDKLRLCHTTI